jgi:hypothetical protein
MLEAECMRRQVRSLTIATGICLAILPLHAAEEVPVPHKCIPQVNAKLQEVLSSGTHQPVDNVMVCGITIGPSRTQRGGRHGSHQILPLLVTSPDGRSHRIEVVTNDDLDGVVTAPAGATVFAFGQSFIPYRSSFEAGIHDVHCSTHRGADNGWVVVNGIKRPESCRF